MKPEVQYSAAEPGDGKKPATYSLLSSSFRGESPAEVEAYFSETDGLPPDERTEMLQLRGLTPAQCRIWAKESDARRRLRHAVTLGWTAEQMWTSSGATKLPIPPTTESRPTAAERPPLRIENLSSAAQYLAARLIAECCCGGNSQNACDLIALDDGTYLRTLFAHGDAPIAYANLLEATMFLRRSYPEQFPLVAGQVGRWYASRKSLRRDSFEACVTQAIDDEHSRVATQSPKAK